MMSPWPNMMPGIQNEVATATAAISTGLARPATTVSTNDMAICAIWPRKTGMARKTRLRVSCLLKCLNMMAPPGGRGGLAGKRSAARQRPASLFRTSSLFTGQWLNTGSRNALHKRALRVKNGALRPGNMARVPKWRGSGKGTQDGGRNRHTGDVPPFARRAGERSTAGRRREIPYNV